MLPTKGYFAGIDCPLFNTDCRRPYCHFRHRKNATATNESGNKSTGPEIKANSPTPTYKPTPKSELDSIKSQKKHVPISYVPDTIQSVNKIHERPTYKPTPKSILATNAQLIKVTPSLEDQNKEQNESSIINNLDLNDLLTEFDMIDDILKDSANDGLVKISSDDSECLKSSNSHKDNTKDKDKHVSRRHKHKSRSKKDKDRSKDNSKNKGDHSERKERPSSHKSESSRKKSVKHDDKANKIIENKIESTVDFEGESYSDNDNDDNIDSLMIKNECMKIFNEYKSTELHTAPIVTTPCELAENAPQTSEEFQSSSKKRVAYSNAAVRNDEGSAKLKCPPRKPSINIGSSIQNRIRLAKQQQANKEVENLLAELRKPAAAKRILQPQTCTSSAMKKPKILQSSATNSKNTSLIDDIISGKTTTTNNKIRRIAPASNVISIQKAKAKLNEAKNASVETKTLAQTYAARGSKRIAHVPDTSLADIPDVLQSANSKLPVNVRTKYLCLMADECVKLYVSLQEAYTRALNEEFKCYERCSIFSTYRNSAMLAVNRLRKELQTRQSAGLGALEEGEGASGKSSQELALEGKYLYKNLKEFLLSPEDLRLHGFPMESPVPGRAVIANKEYQKQQTMPKQGSENMRVCCRCHKTYAIDKKGFPLRSEECCYHPLRKRTMRGEQTYLCCKSTEDTGCIISSTHVSELSTDRELEGYQTTLSSDNANDPRNHAVYALDCEMCYTTKGLELTRVTVVDAQLKTVYESLVKPLNPIIDYNTRFSGLTKEHLDKTSTNILQVQANIMHLCSDKTILIGHSLESDMKALKIIHGTIVDTSIMFPHKFGLPHKRALRALASDYLKKIIQNDVGGHDSAEDALTAMELVLWKVKENLKVKGVKS